MLWNYSLFKDKDFLGFLHAGEYDERLDEVVEQFSHLSKLAQYELIKYVKEKGKPIDVSKLSKALGTKLKTAEDILSQDYKVFHFPAVAKEGSGKLVYALVVKDTHTLYCNCDSLKRHLKPVEEFLRTKGVLEKSLSVFFSQEVTGKSFQLPLALCLYLKNFPEKHCFTGGLDREGNILKVNALIEKEKICEEYDKVFVNPLNLKHIDEIKAWFEKSYVEIPFLVSMDENTNIGELGFSDNVKYLKIFEGLDADYLKIHTGKLEGNKWKEVCTEFIRRIRELDKRLSGRLKLVFSIKGPTSLAFALGILYTWKKPYIVFQYVPEEKRYYNFDVYNPRILKEHAETYEATKSSFEDRGGSQLAVVVSGAHHISVPQIVEYLEENKIDADLLLLEPATKGGNIKQEDFTKVAREYATAIQLEGKARKSYKRFHFFFSTPVALAFMLGTAYGHYDSGYIYQYQSGRENTYMPVIELEFLRKLIEG